MMRMAKTVCIQCRVSEATKAALMAVAHSQGLTLSALLHRTVVGATLGRAVEVDETAEVAGQPVRRSVRMAVRLRGEDALLLGERARGRGLAPATYVSLLVRGHLRNVTPLPDREIEALMKLVAAINAVGRNFNQIARTLHRGGPIDGIDSQAVMQMLRLLESARDHARRLVATNIQSWETGYVEKTR
jgi:hypothetical protein